MFRRHWKLIIMSVKVLDKHSSNSGRLGEEQRPRAQVRDARSMDSPPFIAFFPKPRSGGCLAAEGLGKKAIFLFAVFWKKHSKEDVADKFGLGYLRNSASPR